MQCSTKMFASLRPTAFFLCFLVVVFFGSRLVFQSEYLVDLRTWSHSLPGTGYREQIITNVTMIDQTVPSLMKLILDNADRKIAERRAWLSKTHSDSEQFGKLRAPQLWYMFQPVLPCFWTFEKTPSSSVLHDGGKWLCGLLELHQMRNESNVDYGLGKHYENKCVVYSMGSNNEFAFEKHVRSVASGCEIHTFDPTIKETGKGKAFYDVYHSDFGLGGENSDYGKFKVKSIATIMKELQHTHVDYLKVDVEGFEWEFLNTADWASTKVGQILIELHQGKGVNNPTAKELNDIFNRLEFSGYRLISLEPVTSTKFGQVEAVFIHKDWRPAGGW